MKKMKIRTKMMLWYTLLTTVLLAVFLPVLYNAISKSLYDGARNALKADMAQVVLSINAEEGMFEGTYGNDNHRHMRENNPIMIWNEDGKMIYSNTDRIEFENVTFVPGITREISYRGHNWLYLIIT